MASYRERAEALRTAAQYVHHADNKKILPTTADRYDQLADSIEQTRQHPTNDSPSGQPVAGSSVP